MRYFCFPFTFDIKSCYSNIAAKLKGLLLKRQLIRSLQCGLSPTLHSHTWTQSRNTLSFRLFKGLYVWPFRCVIVSIGFFFSIKAKLFNADFELAHALPCPLNPRTFKSHDQCDDEAASSTTDYSPVSLKVRTSHHQRKYLFLILTVQLCRFCPPAQKLIKNHAYVVCDVETSNCK